MRLRSVLTAALTVLLLAVPAATAGQAALPVAAPAGDVARVIVTTQGAPAAAADAARALGASVTWTYEIIDGFAATVPVAALDELGARADVTGVWPDRPVTTVMDVSHRAIEADKVWASGERGEGVTVAVIDTGIDPAHPFFTGAVVACVSTIAGLVSPECTDSDGHGTHVAGTVASRDDRYPGVAPAANLAVVRVLHAAGVGTSADIIAGMDWVKRNKDRVSPPIRVATMSIGFLDPGCGDDSSPEAKAANALVDAGVAFTVAAGNSGHDRCTIDGASAASKVITVGAVDDRGTVPQDDDVIADFSSGGGEGLQKPDVTFPGVNITSAYIGAGLLIATLDGTSMATPHAAGTAALLVGADPSLTATQVKDRITGSALTTSNTGTTPNTVYGYGLGNACLALGLTTCAHGSGGGGGGGGSEDPATTAVHVADVALRFSHPNARKATQHEVTVAATVVDAAGAPVGGATVAFALTSPEGKAYSASATTGPDGVASVTVRQNKDGHGSWQGCVTGVTGTGISWDQAADRERCDTVTVT